jgi:hypothetical protein
MNLSLTRACAGVCQPSRATSGRVHVDVAVEAIAVDNNDDDNEEFILITDSAPFIPVFLTL